MKNQFANLSMHCIYYKMYNIIELDSNFILLYADYISLVETLESLRMSTDALVSRYYQERYEEQEEGILPTKAQLVARVSYL